MYISDFEFALPDELIARYPLAERRASRLLELGSEIRDRRFADLPALVRAGDLLVFNDTRVIRARLAARKASGGKAEVLIERIEGETRALAQIRASKPPGSGSRLHFADAVEAELRGREGEFYRLEFSVPLRPFLDRCGEVPLPPYLHRPAEPADAERYQTVYAREPGAVAAPTAGLHFDTMMLQQTLELGARHAWVTLHVGAGTFQPLRREKVADNRLHAERAVVDAACCRAVAETRAGGGRVIAVGTTTVRSLESAAASGHIQPLDAETDLFILPGYRFRCVDAIITNFHLPGSSLLMLICAFAGKDRVLDAYAHAVRERYRFFSYGDAMFVTPDDVR